MNTTQFLAGLATEILYRLQNLTRGKIGGFKLYNRLWRIYTNEYTIDRAGWAWDIGLRHD